MISSLDTQMMIQRSVDASRLASERLAQVEEGRDFMRKLQAEQETAERTIITRKSEAEAIGPMRDERGGGNNEADHQGSEAKGKEALPAESMMNLEVGSVPHGLDIEV